MSLLRIFRAQIYAKSLKKLLLKVFTAVYLSLFILLIIDLGLVYLRKIIFNSELKNLHLISECDCRRNETIRFVYSKTGLVDIKSSRDQSALYTLKPDAINSLRLTCDLYNSFRRGPNLKVVSYSLYGNKSLYVRYLPILSVAVKEMYPDWIIRVYHDNSINEKTKCELECLNDSKNLPINNIDFCNINKIPAIGLFETWNAGYLHAMKWRWLPIGDSFVNTFLSRDTDSPIIQREVDAVNTWLASNKSGHIMRGKSCLNSLKKLQNFYL